MPFFFSIMCLLIITRRYTLLMVLFLSLDVKTGCGNARYDRNRAKSRQEDPRLVPEGRVTFLQFRGIIQSVSNSHSQSHTRRDT